MIFWFRRFIVFAAVFIGISLSVACSSSTTVRAIIHSRSDFNARGCIIRGQYQVLEYREHYSPGNMFFHVMDGGRNKYVLIKLLNPDVLREGKVIRVGDASARFLCLLQSDPGPFRQFEQDTLRGTACVLDYRRNAYAVMKLDIEILHGDTYYTLIKDTVRFK